MFLSFCLISDAFMLFDRKTAKRNVRYFKIIRNFLFHLRNRNFVLTHGKNR